METTILFILCLLEIISIIFQIVFRPKANQDLAVILTRQASLLEEVIN